MPIFTRNFAHEIARLSDELAELDIEITTGFRVIAQAIESARFKDRLDEIVEEAVAAIDEAQEEREQGDPFGDARIENQDMGRIEHDNPADYYNTVLKMGKKRAFVDAVLTATGASDIFTQDIEDLPDITPAQGQAPPPTPAPANAAEVEAEIAKFTTTTALTGHWTRHAKAYQGYPDFKEIESLYAKRMKELTTCMKANPETGEVRDPDFDENVTPQEPARAGVQPETTTPPTPKTQEPPPLGPDHPGHPNHVPPPPPDAGYNQWEKEQKDPRPTVPKPDPTDPDATAEMSEDEAKDRRNLEAAANEFPKEYAQARAALGIRPDAKLTHGQVKQVMAALLGTGVDDRKIKTESYD